MSSVTAILVTYNSALVVEETLRALLAEPLISRVMVVDNASSDSTCALIREHFPSVELIENPTNDGFGAANNIALERVTSDFALLINPDATLHAGALEALVRAATHYPDAAIVAPQLFYEDGAYQLSYKTSLFRRERARSSRCGTMEVKTTPPQGDLCAEFISGAVMLLRMKAVREVGGFDAALFFYYEDDDLCLRFRAAGYGLVLAAEAQAVHGMGKSSPRSEASRLFRFYHDTWSRLYMEYKYRGRDAAARMLRICKQRYGFWRVMAAVIFSSSMRARYGARLQAVNDFSKALAEGTLSTPLGMQ